MKSSTKTNKMKSTKRLGRKPLEDKKVPLTLYIRESEIKAHGGSYASRDKLYKLWEKVK